MEQDVVEGEVVPEDSSGSSTEVAVVEPTQQVTLFQTSDPAEVIQKAARVADALKDVLKRQSLTTRIQGKDHVNVEGWQTVGSMMGVFPVPVGVEELPYPNPIPEGVRAQKEKGLAFGFKASFRAQTLSGSIVGGAEAECRRTEGKPWTWGDDHALKSMAQTRAQSKALGSALRFIVTLAGYTGTPAEEMSQQESERDSRERFGPAITKEEAEKLARALTFLTGSADNAIKVYQQIEKDAGYIPSVVSRGILRTAVMLREHNEKKNEEGQVEPGQQHDDG